MNKKKPVLRPSDLYQVPELPAHSYAERRRDRQQSLRALVQKKQVAANVDHIILAVRSPRFSEPKWINKRRLRSDINRAKRRGDILLAGAKQKGWKSRRLQMERIARATEALSALLSEEPYGQWCKQALENGMPLHEYAPRWDAVGKQRTREAASSMRGFEATLIRISRAASRELRRSSLTGEEVWSHAYNKSTWLIADALPEIFLKWFQKTPTTGRNHDNYNEVSGLANSPYIRFAEAVLIDLKVIGPDGPYKRETIKREFDRARKGAPIRRIGAKTLGSD